MTVLITGVAGFIGSQLAQSLLNRGEHVVGVDSLNSYYDVNLKKARLNNFLEYKNFSFLHKNIADNDFINVISSFKGIKNIVHLAAQAGVRHSLTHPFDYIESKLAYHLK